MSKDRKKKKGQQVAVRDHQKPPVKQVAFVRQSFSGPIPPPSILDGYETIYPGAAKEIIEQFLEESSHRRGIERDVVDSEIKNSKDIVMNKRIGLFLAFSVVLAVVSLGFYMVSIGKSDNAAWLVGTVLAGGVAAFITQKTTAKPGDAK